MLCLPYRRPRLEWFLTIIAMQSMRNPQRVHLLGASTLEELVSWSWLVHRALPNLGFSVDTSKPVKAALAGRMLGDGLPLRGLSSSKDLLTLPEPSEATLRRIEGNISYLRHILSAT